MALGVTESKEDSKLYFKVEGEIPVMLLLYVDGLFLTEKRNSLNLKEGDLLGYDALFYRHGGVAECK